MQDASESEKEWSIDPQQQFNESSLLLSQSGRLPTTECDVGVHAPSTKKTCCNPLVCHIGTSWAKALRPEFTKPYFLKVFLYLVQTSTGKYSVNVLYCYFPASIYNVKSFSIVIFFKKYSKVYLLMHKFTLIYKNGTFVKCYKHCSILTPNICCIQLTIVLLNLQNIIIFYVSPQMFGNAQALLTYIALLLLENSSIHLSILGHLPVAYLPVLAMSLTSVVITCLTFDVYIFKRFW